MTSALEGRRSSLLNNSWNETKLRFEQFGFFTLEKKTILFKLLKRHNIEQII